MAKRGRTRTRASRSRAGAQAPAVDFASEYRYVVSDLKRLGVAAAALFGLLVILSFFL
ncbi:MAG: hypothetical protein GXX94_11280 [Chloroflexi bacterium]|nr:hypothetical protein [Chloroflexota bacterium]